MSSDSNKVLKENLMINVLIIEPIEIIINNLENNVYKDSDIPYLENKLENYSNMAMESIGLPKGIGSGKISDYPLYLKSRNYLKYFNILLNYYKSLI